MDRLGWHTTRIVPAKTLTGQVTQVVVGLINRSDGIQIAIRIGEDGDVGILPPQAMAELIKIALATLTEKREKDQR